MTTETDQKKVAAQLCQYAKANFLEEGQEFNEDTLLNYAGIDSFMLVELLVFCERVIGVRVPDSHLTKTNLASMSSLATCITELAQRPVAAPSRLSC